MDSATTLSAPQGQGTTISQSEVDELWNQYQQAQKNPQKAPAATAEQSDGKTISAAELDKLYKDYTKQETLKLGNELRSDPDNEDKFNAYQNATERYYEARGGLGAIKEELTTDENTLKNIARSGGNFLKQQWETAKKAAGARDPFEIWEATKKGSIAGAADFPVLLAQAISLGSEKLGAAFQDIKTEKKDFSGAARTAAERLRDTARYERMIEESLPKDEASRAVAQLSRFGTGIFLPVGGAAAATKTGKALEAVEGAAQATKQVGKATQAAEQAGKIADISAGAVEGGIAGGITGGVRGAVTGALKGGFKETALGKGIAEAAGKAKELTGETIKGGVTGGLLGGALGAGITAATEPTGTPISTGAAPGAVLGAGIGAFGGARGAMRGEVASEAAAPARNPYRDFDGGGAVRIDQNRWAMETGLGVGEQSQRFAGPARETLHRDTLSSHQNMQPNPRHGVSDSVIRYGYDPETRTLQVVMSESTKGDYVPRDRYVYQNVSPELAQRIMNSPSIQAELNAIANEGGSGIRMSRPVITDKQLNSLINDINSGKLDFHPEWGFSKGSGTPPEFQFRAPETAKAEPTSSSFDDFETKDWNPAFFESIGRKAGKAYRGARESVRDFFNPQREAAESEKVSDADIARFRRESRSRGTPVEESQAQGEPQKALGAAPERRALAAAAPLPEQQPVLGTTEVRRPMLEEPQATKERRSDLEAAFADQEAQAVREEQLRKSPQGLQALRESLQRGESATQRIERLKQEAAESGQPEDPARAKRLADIQAAFDDAEAKLAREEQVRQSPESLEQLKSDLAAQEKGKKAKGKKTKEEPPPEAGPAAPAEVTPPPPQPQPAAAKPAASKAPKKKALESLGAKVEKKPEGKVVQPTPKKVEEVSKLASRKQLTAQKTYITKALETLIEDAPDTPQFKSEKDAKDYAKAARDIELYGKSKARGYQGISKSAQKVVDSVMENAEKVTIKVPDDGTFRIVNTKQALESFASKVESKFGKGLTQKKQAGVQLEKMTPKELEEYRMPNEPEKVPEPEKPAKKSEPVKTFKTDVYEDAVGKLDELSIQDLPKSRAYKMAEGFVRKGLITEKQLEEVSRMMKDRDMGLEDVANEVRNSLIINQGLAKKSKKG